MIDGLKLTMTGDELRQRLDERVQDHERRAEWYEHEKTRETDPTKTDDYPMPEAVCEYEEEFHRWRAETLAYMREHIEGGEVYRLGPDDLEFGEILPEKPAMVEQQEYECDNRVGHSLERIAKDVGGSGFCRNAMVDARVRE